MHIIDNDLLSIQESRILAENAYAAKQELASFPQEKLDNIVEAMASAIDIHAAELAHMSAEETDYGNWQDKYVKNKFICTVLREKLKYMRCVGVIKRDDETMTMDVGVPLGVIVALCPATNPVSTTVYKAMIAIKAGNAIVFSPHPRARKTMGKALDILIEAAERAGLPEGALSYLHTVTSSGTDELMKHQYTSLIMNTGVPAMLKAAYKAGKPVIYGGAGNGPTFIERTADIKQAASDIISSKSFDYGIVSAAEQSVVVDGCIDAQVKEELKARGAYFMTQEEADGLGKLFYRFDGTADTEILGKSATVLANRAGFSVPEGTRVLVAEQRYFIPHSPYAKEKLCPVLAYYVEDDWRHACEKCIEMLLSERGGHTLVIHSKDEDVIRQFALKKPVGRVLVNTPAVFGSMGVTTDIFPAMTLGSGSAGEGMTSDNVSPMNLIYVRKVGYGVRNAEDVVRNILKHENLSRIPATSRKIDDEGMKKLQFVLEKILESIGE